jgi:hypothetical protein
MRRGGDPGEPHMPTFLTESAVHANCASPTTEPAVRPRTTAPWQRADGEASRVLPGPMDAISPQANRVSSPGLVAQWESARIASASDAGERLSVCAGRGLVYGSVLFDSVDLEVEIWPVVLLGLTDLCVARVTSSQ